VQKAKGKSEVPEGKTERAKQTAEEEEQGKRQK
jgi:hypothetical protein